MTQLADGLAEAKRTARVRSLDVLALTKPRITLMVIITTVGGLLLAQRAGAAADRLTPWLVGWTMLGTALVVAGANVLNMYMEREIDGKMSRTKNRPLPSGRLAPRVALWFGVVLSAASVPILAIGVNPLTALLAVLANVSYVLAYTPMKQRSHHALLVGAVPGAIPPLLGWTAATGRIDAAGMVLFSVLFLWQVPHFLAITLFRRAEYARAGLVVMPNVTGTRDVKHAIVRWSLALVGASLLLVPLGVAHWGYFAVAAVLGAMFFGLGCWGLRDQAGRKWARALFGVSILYLLLLFVAVGVDPLS
jgi:protoheme IX farnesyltransferase